ncbi:MAG: hypothetical protein AB1736_05290 [Chloroflexota bacterium]
MRGRLMRRSGGVLAVYVIAALLLTAEAWRGPTTGWAGICCDQAQAIWFLGWTPYAIGQGLDPFFTTMIGAPDGVNLMWNASMPILGLVAWLPTRLGGPIFAYNAMLVAGIALSGWTAWFAVRRYAGDGLGPLVGGAVYAFSPYVASHAALHLNLATAWVPPLFLIVLDELLVRRRHPARRLGVALGLLSVVQLLITEEVLATSVLAAGVLVLVLAACRRDAIQAGARRVVPALAAATVTFLVVGGWPLAAQFFGPQRISEQVQDAATFSTDLLNIGVPTSYQLLAPEAATAVSRDFSGLFHEATAYLGLPLLALLAAVAIRRWADLRIRVATVTGLVLLVLSLGPRLHVGAVDTGIPMPWAPLGSLPIVEHVLPGRLTLFAWLAIASVVAIVVAEAARRPVEAAAPRLLAVAAALVLVLPAPLARSTIEVPEFFRTWSEQGIGADETVLVAPYFHGGAGADPMVWAAVAGHGLRMPEAYAYVPGRNGETRTSPPPTQLTHVMQAIGNDGGFIVAGGEVRARIADDLRAAGVRHVIVGPMANRSPMLAFFEHLFGRPPADVGGVSIWRDVDVNGVAPEPPADE